MDKSGGMAFGWSGAGLKKRIKERNKKWTGLGRTCEPPPAGAGGAAGSPERLRSVRANNRALALALQQERARRSAAREDLLYLKGENQCLKLHIFYLQTLLHSQAPAENGGMFPSVPVTIPVVTGQEHCVGDPQYIVEYKEMPESEVKATTDDSKPAGFISEDCCESTSAIKEVEPECGQSFEPSRGYLQNVTSTACSGLSTGMEVVDPAQEGPLPPKCRRRHPTNHEA